MKKIINYIAAFFGQEVRARSVPMRPLREGLRLLSLSVKPRTVIDVGVASGTPPLYEFFPPESSAYLLVDADPYYAASVCALAESLPAKAEYAACGKERGHATLHTFSDHRKSSFGMPLRSLVSAGDVTVPVQTLDSMVEKHALTGPYLLKIDVEGAEMDVLYGSEKVLSNACAVVMEVSIAPRFKNDTDFSNIVCHMRNYGFKVSDIVGGALDKRGCLRQADIIFIRS